MTGVSGKEKIMLSGFLWCCAIGGICFGVILPLMVRLGSFAGLYRDAAYRLQELEGNIARFASTQKEFESISANIQTVRQRWLDPKEAITFVKALESLAKAESLYQEIRLVSEPSLQGADEVAKTSFVFSMTLAGPYDRLTAFLARLEHFTYIVDVERISLQPSKGSISYRSSSALGETSVAYTPSVTDVSATMQIRVHSL